MSIIETSARHKAKLPGKGNKMFGITARDMNGTEYSFAIDTVEQVRKFAKDCKAMGTGIASATYKNEELAFHDMARLAYGSLPWEFTGARTVATW